MLRVPAELTNGVMSLYVYVCDCIDSIGQRDDDSGVPIVGKSPPGDTKVAAAIITQIIMGLAPIAVHNGPPPVEQPAEEEIQ